MGTLSVNQMAWKKAQKFIETPESYGVTVSKSSTGATIVDAGVKASGGFQAGKLLTELMFRRCRESSVRIQNIWRLNFSLSHCFLRFPSHCHAWARSLQDGALKNQTAQ